jgi:hypothetical protein
MTDFEYSAFISYRNGVKSQELLSITDEKDNLLDNFAKQLYNLLLSELGQQVDTEKIFLDQIYLKQGDNFVIKIGNALCGSLCYVVIFTRNYLSKKKLFCAAELMGMLALEEKRFEKLGVTKPSKSFIFTIPLGNPELVPNVLKNTIYKKHDFTSFTLAPEDELLKNKNYTLAIRELAQEIGGFYSSLEDDTENVLNICNDFSIKNPKDANDKAEIEIFVNTHRIKGENILLNS